jgi:hypothetical protein
MRPVASAAECALVLLWYPDAIAGGTLRARYSDGIERELASIRPHPTREPELWGALLIAPLWDLCLPFMAVLHWTRGGC